jgi:hypothetical protein
MNKHTEQTALNSLFRKGAQIELGKILKVKRNSLGNGSLGKLSFLKNYCGWHYMWVS